MRIKLDVALLATVALVGSVAAGPKNNERPFAPLGGALASGVSPADRDAVHSACEAKASTDHMTITRWQDVRQTSADIFQADVTVDYNGSPYERTCTYHGRSHAVDFSDKPGSTPMAEMGAEKVEHQRARQACEAKAQADGMQILSWERFQQMGDDKWESHIRVSWKGQTYERTCIYKDKSQNVEIK